MDKPTRQQLITELIEYYDCPPELADEAADRCEADPGREAEYVEALIEASKA